ncbi:hypothetical protein CISG_10251 [Coccidioides immitis RMSCC 3703]|uniref:Uncharacterized protein n=1 Tax=Coccidioides immitis RMSCC 3703 TaxID=454286 RepID=A0A0J8QS10_COCIT|nr:hypothetical protein CISG_10251 [Coccidioides immitis RMSCC 3703]
MVKLREGCPSELCPRTPEKGFSATPLFCGINNKQRYSGNSLALPCHPLSRAVLLECFKAVGDGTCRDALIAGCPVASVKRVLGMFSSRWRLFAACELLAADKFLLEDLGY